MVVTGVVEDAVVVDGDEEGDGGEGGEALAVCGLGCMRFVDGEAESLSVWSLGPFWAVDGGRALSPLPLSSMMSCIFARPHRQIPPISRSLRGYQTVFRERAACPK